MSMTGRVLGLGCGQPYGSAEILLKVALRAAEGEGAEVELVRLDELRMLSEAEGAGPDDARWLWDRLVECDGLIVSTPIMSRTVSARLKLLVDWLLGPNADAAIIDGLLALRREGREPAVPFRVDERVLKPRVAGFLAVGGSLTSQWKTLTLPLMHATTFSMHIAVVDQVQFEGAGTPRSVVLDQAALDRAAVLGRNVAGQLGVPFDQARYLGPPGLCPMCHLDVVVLRGPDVECATCGARGRLTPDLQVTWTNLATSVISMDEKQAHAAEIQQTAERHRELRAEIDERALRDDLVRAPLVLGPPEYPGHPHDGRRRPVKVGRRRLGLVGPVISAHTRDGPRASGNRVVDVALVPLGRAPGVVRATRRQPLVILPDGAIPEPGERHRRALAGRCAGQAVRILDGGQH